MTSTLDRDLDLIEEPPAEAPAPTPDDGATATGLHVPLRPLLVAVLSTSAAALMTGGIFGSWLARAMCVAATVFGTFWAWLSLRAGKRETLLQAALLPVSLAMAFAVLVPGVNGRVGIGNLISSALRAGRLLQPPIPFDPGWRPILLLVFVGLGFATAFVAVDLDRPMLAVALPLPVLVVTAMTQPKHGQFLTAVLGFAPLVMALAILFRGDASSASGLSRSFEVRRTVRTMLAFAPAVIALALLNNASFLFPKPVFNPQAKPQKPKSIPLSQARDRVLFTVSDASGGKPAVTGPWHLGALDTYENGSWLLPPFDPKKVAAIPAGGVLDPARSSGIDVKFTTGDLGDSSVLPGLVDPGKVAVSGNFVVDRRSGTVRQAEGRLPSGLTFIESRPVYPTAAQLRQSPPPDTARFSAQLKVAPAPPAVTDLLSRAPANPWDRLDFLRSELNKVVIAAGAGVPEPVPPSAVQNLLVGDHKGSPFMIVAAQVELARWAGIPARIGFGFDGLNEEGHDFTVRPSNAAEWLEVYFEGYGWVPIVGAPPRAQQQLDNNKNTIHNPQIQPSDDVAVQMYIPVELPNLRLLYERIRDVLLTVAPFVLVLVLLYLALPIAKKAWRRRKRRRWAVEFGARAAVAVEYAELRDLTTDLGRGDPLDTPLEFLERVVDDAEHQELAWLVTRALYGDLRDSVGAADAATAARLSASLRRRLLRAQPTQTRLLAALSRSSLARPYTTEVPNVRLWRIPRPWSRQRTRRRQSRVASVLNVPARLFRAPALAFRRR